MKVTAEMMQRFRECYRQRVGWDLRAENVTAALEAALAPLPEPDAWKQRDRDATHWYERWQDAEAKLARVREWARENGYRRGHSLTDILDEAP